MSHFWNRVKVSLKTKGTFWMLGGASIWIWMCSLRIWMQGEIENPWLGGLALILAIGWTFDEIRSHSQTEKWKSTPSMSHWTWIWFIFGGGAYAYAWGILIHSSSLLSLNAYDGEGLTLYTQGICIGGGGMWCIWKAWMGTFLNPHFNRRLFFPLWLFGLTIPWEALIRHLNQPLQEKATDLAVWMLDGAHTMRWVDFRVEYWDSYTFYSDQFYLIINETCSGVNLLISMTLYALGFAWVTQSNQRQSLWILAYTLTLCLFFNAVRIVMIFLLGHYGDRELAMGPWHEGSGYVVQGLFFILLALLRFTLLKDHRDAC